MQNTSEFNCVDFRFLLNFNDLQHKAKKKKKIMLLRKCAFCLWLKWVSPTFSVDIKFQFVGTLWVIFIFIYLFVIIPSFVISHSWSETFSQRESHAVWPNVRSLVSVELLKDASRGGFGHLMPPGHLLGDVFRAWPTERRGCLFVCLFL